MQSLKRALKTAKEKKNLNKEKSERKTEIRR